MLITLCDTCVRCLYSCVCAYVCETLCMSECRPSWHLNTTHTPLALGGPCRPVAGMQNPQGSTALLAVAVLCQQPGTHNSVAGWARVTRVTRAQQQGCTPMSQGPMPYCCLPSEVAWMRWDIHQSVEHAETARCAGILRLCWPV
jgi:hypothetical protein